MSSEELSETAIEALLDLNEKSQFTRKIKLDDWVISQLQLFCGRGGTAYRGLRFTIDQYEHFKEKNHLKKEGAFSFKSGNYSSWTRDINVASDYASGSEIGIVIECELPLDNILVDTNELPTDIFERLEYKNEGREVICLPGIFSCRIIKSSFPKSYKKQQDC